MVSSGKQSVKQSAGSRSREREAKTIESAAQLLKVSPALLKTFGKVSQYATSEELEQLLQEVKTKRQKMPDLKPSDLVTRSTEKQVQFDSAQGPRFICYRGPPTARPKMPLLLTCRPFIDFRTNAASMPEAVDMNLAHELWDLASVGWDSETQQMTPQLNDLFIEYLGQPISPIGVSGNLTDGLVEGTMILFEHKLLLADGFLQGLDHLRLRFLRFKKRKPTLTHGLFILLARPYIQVVAVVMDWRTEKVAAEPLTDLVNCFGAPEHELTKLAAVARAIRLFCKNYDPFASVDPRLPYMLMNKQVQEIQRLVYLVDPDRVVKLTMFYSKEAHECWAKKNLAPSLLDCKSIGAGWIMVEMSYLGCKDGWFDAHQVLSARKDDPVALAALTGCIMAAAKEAHATGYVHGDMRLPNIKLRPRADGSADVMFLDFDWAGKEGEARYPVKLNPDIKWHQDAEFDSPIKKEHDLHFVNHLAAQL